MKKNEILQFEADDASKMGVNGKQVFFTKRINGKTTHNKLKDNEVGNFLNQYKKDNLDDQLFIQVENIKYEKNNDKKNNDKNNNKVKRKKLSKKDKKNRKKKRILRFATIILLIVALIIFALVSPIFNIKTIKIDGNKKVDSSTIQSLSGIKTGENIFKINKKSIINNIKQNAYIDKVIIKRNIPSTIEITVKEREVAYQVKVVNCYVYLDYQGYILEVSKKQSKVPMIEGFSTGENTLLTGKRISNEDITSSINNLLKIMETAKSAEIWDLITSINIKNGEYILKLNKENKTVYLGSANDLTNMMMYVKIILKEEKDKEGEIFVDGNLNKGFKPYFREKIKQEILDNGKEEKNE